MTAPRPRVLFIGGIGRSGTTLLEQALGQHPDVVGLGETLHLWKRGLLLNEKCGCGAPFRDCEFWTAIGAHAFGGWDRVDPHRVIELRSRLDRVRRLPTLARRRVSGPDAAAIGEYADYFDRIHAAAADLTGASVVVDSSKQITLAFCLSHLPHTDVRVLQAVRDSRAVAYSWSTVVKRPDSTDGTTHMDRYPPALIAARWVSHNAATALLPIRDVPRRRLRYEDFADHPGRAIRQVSAYAGIDVDTFPAGVIGDHDVTVATQHTVSGNPVRFQTGPVSIRRDERWRDHLPRTTKTLVGAITWPLLLRYGYPVRSGAALSPRSSDDLLAD